VHINPNEQDSYQDTPILGPISAFLISTINIEAIHDDVLNRHHPYKVEEREITI